MPSSTIIELKNVTLEREDSILTEINLRVNKGERWVIMGPNGSGKSTLIHLLSGYLLPSSGSLEVLSGIVCDDHGWADKRRHIGIVSAHISQMIESDELAGDVVLSGRDGVLNVWEQAPASAVQATIQVLKDIDAWHLRDREWGLLSQGERQRILIGRALMNHAKILILDEPCAGLDPAAREHYLHFLESLLQSKPELTPIMITHHVEEITSSFSHALLLREGQVQRAGTIAETMTSKSLSALFESDIELTHEEGRFYSRVKTHTSHTVF